MSTQKNIERWIAEAGVQAEDVKFQRESKTPVVWSDCYRCGGAGYFRVWGHIHEGRCFQCGGGKGKWVALSGVAARKRNAAKKAERRAAQVSAKIAEVEARALAFLRSNPALVKALEVEHNILADLAAKLQRFGCLSDKQIELALKVAAEQKGRDEERAAQDAAAVDVPEGRHAIEGKVLSIKEQESQFGVSWKLLLDCGDYRLFGSLPRSIDPLVKVGDIVRLSAELQPKEKGFGFYKRPTKASIIKENA
jgi:hypothetical protein